MYPIYYYDPYTGQAVRSVFSEGTVQDSPGSGGFFYFFHTPEEV